jgi:outer membrane protein
MAKHLKCLLRVLALSAAVWMAGVNAPRALAESLAESLATAYENNPTLRAERARQRQTDEQVPQALSGWRPTVSVQATAAFQNTDVDIAGTKTIFPPPTFRPVKVPAGQSPVESWPADVQITLTQPVFRGFRTVEEIARAESTVRAGRQNLLAVEQQVLFNTVQAYMNILRDRRILKLEEQNVAALRVQLRAAETRFSVGEVTRTDVSQARSRLALEQVNLATAKFNLATSVANYTNVVGHPPGSLTYPKMVKLPKSLEASLTIAERLNPNILSAAFIEDAAVHAINVVKGNLLPTISLQASGSESTGDLRGSPFTDQQVITVGGTIIVPLYQSGAEYSAIREAKHAASQRRIEIVETGRNVRESVTSSWSAVQTTYQTIAAGRVQVAAARQALEGVRQEYLVGSRTTLDVLDAERELYAAQITLAREERDLIVAGYQVLGAMGKLTAKNLKLNVDYYDVEANYLAVRDKWFGTGVETVK